MEEVNMIKTGYKSCQRRSKWRKESGKLRRYLGTPQSRINYFGDIEFWEITMIRDFAEILLKRGLYIGKRAPFKWEKPK